MWVRDEEFERLKERVKQLEDGIGYGGYGKLPLWRAVGMILEHLGLHLDLHLEHFSLSKKGGPERGS